MIGILSIVTGLLIVLVSVMLIRREFLRANKDHKRSFNSLSDENVTQVMQYLKKIEKELDDLNAAYYEIVSDLEGKYSVHDKEIELLQEKLEAIKVPKKHVAAVKSIVVEQELDEKERICLEAVRMRQEGLSIGQIARELNMGIGELQLLLKTKR